MAGLGFKDFQVGEVLTSSDVDGYLMQQAVMRFADAAARGSALGTAVGTAVPLAEGMVAYLDDANQMQVYDGAGWNAVVPGVGNNVVQTVKTDTFSTTSTSFTGITNLTAAITPTSSSSKVLVIAHVNYGISETAAGGCQFRLTGGNAGTFIGDAASNRIRTVVHNKDWPGVGPVGQSATIVYLDSPATTSSTTYGVEARAVAGTFYVNRSATDTDNVQYGRMASSITVMEVAA